MAAPCRLKFSRGSDTDAELIHLVVAICRSVATGDADRVPCVTNGRGHAEDALSEGARLIVQGVRSDVGDEQGVVLSRMNPSVRGTGDLGPLLGRAVTQSGRVGWDDLRVSAFSLFPRKPMRPRRLADRTMRVCLVSPAPPPYGGISHWTQMVLGYAETRRDVVIDHVDIAPPTRAIHETGALRRVLKGTPQMLSTSYLLARRLATQRPDVVHLTSSGQLAIFRDILMLALCRAWRVPAVYHIRFGRLPQVLAQPSAEGGLFKVAARLSSCVLTLDAGTQESVAQAVHGRTVARLPNPVDFTDLPLVGAGGAGGVVGETLHHALFVGWVIPSKGVIELIEAWCALRPKDWLLTVAGPGDGALIATLQSRAAMAGALVDFPGAVAHREALAKMATCDVFVLPSHTEGFPNVVAEAMALGKCVVASEVGAISEMLAEGRGVLCPPKNTAALGAALNDVIGARSQRVALGQAARTWAEATLSLSSVFDSYLGLWRSHAAHYSGGAQRP